MQSLIPEQLSRIRRWRQRQPRNQQPIADKGKPEGSGSGRHTGLEVDAIVENRQGDWCAFEVKLGAGQVDNAASVLLKFRERVDIKKSGLPRMLGVIVSSGYGYLREDGIAVIPIGALGP